jgi:hypothetical protein
VPGRASGPSRSSGRRRRRIAMCSRNLIGYLGFFLSGGLYRWKDDVRGGPRRPHTGPARPGVGPRHPCVWGPGGPTPSLLQISGSFWVKYDFRNLFRPILRIFPVYHFWNTKTAKNRKLALWQLINRLVPENA